MKLYIFRHGETEWNTVWRLQGQTDIALNEVGLKMAEETSEALKDERFDIFFSSPLDRALTTAKIIRRDRNVPIITDDRLREVSFGIYEGTVPAERPKEFQLFFDAPEKYVAPEGAESYEALIERVREFLLKKVFPINDTNPNASVVICGHGAMNKALIAVLLKREIKDIWKGPWQKNCSMNLFDIDIDGTITYLEEGKIFYNE